MDEFETAKIQGGTLLIFNQQGRQTSVATGCMVANELEYEWMWVRSLGVWVR